jgi:hypothetical protein
MSQREPDAGFGAGCVDRARDDGAGDGVEENASPSPQSSTVGAGCAIDVAADNDEAGLEGARNSSNALGGAGLALSVRDGTASASSPDHAAEGACAFDAAWRSRSACAARWAIVMFLEFAPAPDPASDPESSPLNASPPLAPAKPCSGTPPAGGLIEFVLDCAAELGADGDFEPLAASAANTSCVGLRAGC